MLVVGVMTMVLHLQLIDLAGDDTAGSARSKEHLLQTGVSKLSVCLSSC